MVAIYPRGDRGVSLGCCSAVNFMSLVVPALRVCGAGVQAERGRGFLFALVLRTAGAADRGVVG